MSRRFLHLSDVSRKISIYIWYTVFSLREEAAGYVQEQTKWDSRRGLKRSWTASPEEGPSTGARPTAEEKGQYKFCSDPIKEFLEFKLVTDFEFLQNWALPPV